MNAGLFEKENPRNAIHGDGYSDINTYSAAMFFKDSGYTKSCFLPMFYYADNKGIHPEPAIYTHYPAVPDILAGSYAKLFDTRSEKTLRLSPVMLSLLFFLIIFYALQQIIPEKKSALISSLVIVLSNYFIFWGDNLHKHLYEELLKWLYTIGLWNYYRNARYNKWLLAGLAICYVIETNVSFEPVVYLAIVTVGIGYIHTRRLLLPENLLLLLMPVAGFAIHLYQNYCWFGSWPIVINDFKDAAVLRTKGGNDIRNELQRNIQFKDFLNIPFIFLNRIERFFLFPGYAMLIFGYLAWQQWKNQPQLRQLMLVLLIATLSWSVLMTQHFTVHAFTGRHAGLLYALIIGTGLMAYEQLFRKHISEKKITYMLLHVLFIGYNLVMLISQQVLDIFKYGFLL